MKTNSLNLAVAVRNGVIQHGITAQNVNNAEELIMELEEEAFEEVYRDLTYRDVVPVSFGNNMAVAGYHQRIFDIQGKAKIIGGYSDDLPSASYTDTGRQSPVRILGISYHWNIVEIARALAVGEAVEENRAEAARFGMENSLNDIAYYGEEEAGLFGLFNHPSIAVASVSANAAGTSTLWADKSADEISADISSMVNQMVIDTNGRYRPTQLMLPYEQYYLIANQRLPNRDKSVLAWIVENNPDVPNAEFFKAVKECKGAGIGGADIAVVIDKNPRHAEMKVPYAPQFLAAQPDALHFKRPMLSTVGGMVIRAPESITIHGGI